MTDPRIEAAARAIFKKRFIRGYGEEKWDDRYFDQGIPPECEWIAEVALAAAADIGDKNERK